jgi:hypothetical protein
MIKLEMYVSWLIGFILGVFILTALTLVGYLQDLFDLPLDAWDIVKNKYDEIE